MASSTSFYGRAGLHTECYDAFHGKIIPGTSVAGDAGWYAARARERNGPVLEGACGTGRVAWEIARAGVEVVGFDISPAMLALAEAKREGMPREAASRATFLPGDLRSFDLGGRTFPLALVPFRAFQALLTPEEQLASLACFRRHLAPGGRLVLDLFDPNYAYLQPGSRPPREFVEVEHPDRHTRVRVALGDREVDVVRQVFAEEWEFREIDASGTVVREERETLSLRWSFRYEMLHLFARAGFEVEAEYSDFQGSPPAYGKEQVWVLRRPS